MPAGLIPSNPSPYWSPEIAKRHGLESYLNLSDNVIARDYTPQALPKYDYAALAGQANYDASNQSFQNALNGAQQASDDNFGGSPRLAAILRALRAQESGGNYGAVNSDSGAMGAYQVMPSNIAGSGGWDMEALGRNITQQQFLNNRRLQNKIARYKFGNYLDQYGLKGALSSWYSGSPTAWNDRDPQGNYPSIHEYVMQVLARLRNQ